MKEDDIIAKLEALHGRAEKLAKDLEDLLGSLKHPNTARWARIAAEQWRKQIPGTPGTPGTE